MDIRNSLDGLKSLLGVNQAAPAATQTKGSAATKGSSFSSDSATLSSAGSEVSQGVFGRRGAHGQSLRGAVGAVCGNL